MCTFSIDTLLAALESKQLVGSAFGLDAKLADPGARHVFIISESTVSEKAKFLHN